MQIANNKTDVLGAAAATFPVRSLEAQVPQRRHSDLAAHTHKHKHTLRRAIIKQDAVKSSSYAVQGLFRVRCYIVSIDEPSKHFWQKSCLIAERYRVRSTLATPQRSNFHVAAIM